MPMTTRRRRPPAEGEVEVFGVDEQARPAGRAGPLGRPRHARAARLRACGGEAELSLLFVDEAVMADLNQRFMGADGPHRRAGLPARRPDRRRAAGPTPAAPAPTASRPSSPSCRCCSATSWCARRWPPARRPSTPAATTTSSPCSWCTACSTCSAWTTPTPRRPRRCRPASASCSTATTTDR